MSVTDASFPIINWSKAMPSLRQLMYFACVAEYGSIGQAAEVLHVSQPSLSRQIQALEVHIGEALFVRGPAGVSLTEVGRVVHCRAVKIIAEAKALTRDIGDGDDRQLHIGFSRYLDPGWSGELARQLKEARVCSAVSPSWAPSLDLLSLVRESSLDAAIIGAPPKVVREYEPDGDRQLRARHRPVGNPAPATGARLVAERPDWRAATGTEGLAVSRLQPVHERCDGCRRLRAPAQRAAERPEHSPGPGRQRRRLRLPAVVADQVRLSGVAFTALPAAVNEGFRLPVGLAVSPTSRLRASDTQFECFVETARRVAAG